MIVPFALTTGVPTAFAIPITGKFTGVEVLSTGSLGFPLLSESIAVAPPLLEISVEDTPLVAPVPVAVTELL